MGNYQYYYTCNTSILISFVVIPDSEIQQLFISDKICHPAIRGVDKKFIVVFPEKVYFVFHFKKPEKLCFKTKY